MSGEAEDGKVGGNQLAGCVCWPLRVMAAVL